MLAECEEEGEAMLKCYEQAATPIPYPSALLGGKEVEDLAVKLSFGRRETWWGGVFIFVLFLTILLCY